MGERCTGHCCRLFFAPITPAKIKRCLEELDKFPRRDPWPSGLTLPVNYETILDMLIPDRPVVEGGRPPGQKTQKFSKWAAEDGYLYRCKHFDEESHDCRIYDRRPQMCREYPYGNPCDFDGCTYAPEKPVKMKEFEDEDCEKEMSHEIRTDARLAPIEGDTTRLQK